MWSEANYRRVHQDSDEDLGLEELICSGDPERLSQTGQTPGQGAEHLVKDHLSCAVILKKTENTHLNLRETKIFL